MVSDPPTDQTIHIFIKRQLLIIVSVAVLLLFLITEIPQGVLGLLSGILGRCFFKNCYHQLGELMDILALINGAINFILYCSMSRQFRDTFSKMFKPRILAKCAPPNTEVQSTYV